MADWNERYRRGEHATIEPSQLLVQAVDGLAPGQALDLACGAGRQAIFLAERGWKVTALDASPVGIELVNGSAHERGVEVDARVADLEQGQFVITPNAYDLICVFYYLQRNLFPQIRAGLRPGGTVVAAIHTVDQDADEKGKNPAFFLMQGELCAEFQGWEITHYTEGQPQDAAHRRRTAELIARRRNNEK
ncbi:MAG: methyltransferase domain-containing protein [Pyrinomonadaceae bacterium]|nr:methyltransferase domain-containing protein [Pyrinomonadaceae bacterium]